MHAEHYSFTELCEVLGKSRVFVSRLQRTLELPIPRDSSMYTEAYLRFLEKVVALRAFSISMDDIKGLFLKERKILEMLHFDTINPSPAWYLEACVQSGHPDRTLLLTGWDLGFALATGTIQANLDFGPRDAELFRGEEMGEDIRQVLQPYLKLLDSIRQRVENERPVLINALHWSRAAFGGSSE